MTAQLPVGGLHRPHDLGHFFGVRLPALLQYCCICAQGNPSVSTHAMVGPPVGAAVGRAVGADVGATATINNSDKFSSGVSYARATRHRRDLRRNRPRRVAKENVSALGSVQSAL